MKSSQSSTVTLKVFNEYKQVITDTTYDLQNRLQDIEGNLRMLVSCRVDGSDDGTDVQRQVEEDRDAIVKCLQICDEVSNHINRLDAKYFPLPVQQDSKSRDASTAFSAWVAAGQTLAGCKSQLQEHVDELRMRLTERPERPERPESEAERARIVEEIHGLQKSIDICNKAYKEADRHRTNVFEDISTGDDTRQVIVSTIGDLVFAKTLKTGARSFQVLGQMSDETVQNTTASINNIKNTEHSDDSAHSYQSRYGPGRELRWQAKSG